MGSRVRKRPAPKAELLPYILPGVPQEGPIDFGEVFSNAHPLEVEIGFGKGRYLLTAAELRREHNFLGIELSHGLVDFAADRLRIRTLTHAKVLHADALAVLKHHIRPASVRAVHFYFPDPWWKKKHHKRRVFTPQLFEAIVGVLEPGGSLHIASDVPFVYEQLYALASARAEFTERPPEPLPCTTNFEDKAHRDGRPVQRTAFQKD